MAWNIFAICSVVVASLLTLYNIYRAIVGIAIPSSSGNRNSTATDNHLNMGYKITSSDPIDQNQQIV